MESNGTYLARVDRFTSSNPRSSSDPSTHDASLCSAYDPHVHSLLLHMQRGSNREMFAFDDMQEGSIVLVVRSEEEEREVKTAVQRQDARVKLIFKVKLEH